MFAERFDPLAFFSNPTRGAAVITDVAGRLIRRCVIETTAEPNPEFDALHFDERFHFDDGTPTDVLNWAVRWDADGKFEALEPSVDGELKSTLAGAAWKLRFRRLAGVPMI